MPSTLRTRSASAGALLTLFLAAGCASSGGGMQDTGMMTPAPAAAQSMPAAAPMAPMMSNVPRTDTVRARPFDNGRMWTFDFPPTDYIQQTYGFRPDDKWLENVRQSSLKFATWCSASFVSADGLIMTNHHCARETFDAIQKPGEDFLTNGFYAKTRAEERQVPDLFVEQLRSIEDVTAKMTAPLQGDGTEQEKVQRQGEVRTELQKSDDPTMRYQVVEFYNGGRYSRYGFKKYTDIRLVMAPEGEIAFFGGDPDNFTYPRYDLDMSFYRAYDEKGEPLHPEHYYRWSASGAKEGDPVFVIGNPGRTNRLSAMSQLDYTRDVQQPALLAFFTARINAYKAIGAADPKRGLELRNDLFGIQNSYKAINGQNEGLKDPFFHARKEAFERDLRAAIAAKPALQQQYGSVWDDLAKIQAQRRELYPKQVVFNYLFVGPMGTAVSLVRGAAADSSARVEMLKAKSGPKAEQVMEFAMLLQSAHKLYPNDETINAVLAGRTPQATAQAIVGGSKIDDPAFLQQLFDGGETAIAASDDPALVAARMVLPMLMGVIRTSSGLAAQETVRRNMLGRAMYEVYGTKIPPDATFTLRLADGVVKSYEAAGTLHPAFTTFYGLFNRYIPFKDNPEFALPKRWQTPTPGMNLSTPFNFVATNDIIGGNSGSAMVNKDMEVVGLVFDGNIESLPGSFIYDESQNRTVSVHSAGIIEALRSVYKAQRLVDELLAAKPAMRGK